MTAKTRTANRDGSTGAEPSPTFCILPWTHLFVDNLGVLYPCCQATETRSPNVDDRGENLTLQSAPVAESFNSGYMRELRKQMLEGGRPSVCRKCYRDEDFGLQSYRKNANKDFAHILDEVVASAAADGTAPAKFASIDLRLGNVCNLRCRMCSPYSASTLIPEWSKLMDVPRERFERYRRVDWFKDPGMYATLESCSENLEQIMLAGGEPLLVEHHFDLLQSLVDSGRAGSVKLTYITNGTVLPERVYDYWPLFESVRLIVSVDGHGPINDFIRYPSRWEKVEETVRRFDEDADRLNVSELNINTTVQVYNVLSLTDLLRWVFSFERMRPLASLNVLVEPPCFDIQVLPDSLKDLAAARLREFVDNEVEGNADLSAGVGARIRQQLDGIITHMTAASRTAEIPQFVARNAVFDTHRKQRAVDVLPELAPLFALADDAAESG